MSSDSQSQNTDNAESQSSQQTNCAETEASQEVGKESDANPANEPQSENKQEDLKLKESDISHNALQISLKLDPEQLKKDKELGRGKHCVVFSGTYQGGNVAIKEVIDSEDEKKKKQIEEEVMMLDRLHHDAIVRFIGALLLPEQQQVIVTELCQFGTMEQAMHEHPEAFNETLKAKCLLNISSAMKYLHSENVVHGNLKPSKVMIVSVDGRSPIAAKLSGIGRNTIEESGPYAAPEVLRHSDTKEKAIDVYSFSIVMYWIYSGRVPSEDATQIMSGKRPSVPSSCPKTIGTLIGRCWNDSASARPTFDEVQRLLSEFYDECKYGKEGMNARQKSAGLLKSKPELDKEESVTWKDGGGIIFSQLCELVKTNGVMMKKLEFKGKNENVESERQRVIQGK